MSIEHANVIDVKRRVAGDAGRAVETRGRDVDDAGLVRPPLETAVDLWPRARHAAWME